MLLVPVVHLSIPLVSQSGCNLYLQLIAIVLVVIGPYCLSINSYHLPIWLQSLQLASVVLYSCLSFATFLQSFAAIAPYCQAINTIVRQPSYNLCNWLIIVFHYLFLSFAIFAAIFCRYSPYWPSINLYRCLLIHVIRLSIRIIYHPGLILCHCWLSIGLYCSPPWLQIFSPLLVNLAHLLIAFLQYPCCNF